MLLFDQKTGCLASVLLDEGHLTDARTGAAGAMAVFYLAKRDISQITIIGAGIQAREQAKSLLKATSCRNLVIWARNSEKGAEMVLDAQKMGYQAVFEEERKKAIAHSDVVITTTPATAFLIQSNWVRSGTFIVAVGADTADKQELDPVLLARADKVMVDSLSQSQTRGEVYQARKNGSLNSIQELGFCLQNIAEYRQKGNEICVVDLTGVAVQDLAIAQSVFFRSE